MECDLVTFADLFIFLTLHRINNYTISAISNRDNSLGITTSIRNNCFFEIFFRLF